MNIVGAAGLGEVDKQNHGEDVKKFEDLQGEESIFNQTVNLVNAAKLE